MRGPAWTLTLVNSDRVSPVTARIEWPDVDVFQLGREVTPGHTGRPWSGPEVALEPGEVRVYASH